MSSLTPANSFSLKKLFLDHPMEVILFIMYL